MSEVQEAKTRLLEWAKQSDSTASASHSLVGPALASAAAGLVLAQLLPGRGKRGSRGVVSSLLGSAFSIATIAPIAKALLPVLLKKL
ncbi:MAG: hypothetical protein ACREJD_15280 [Phycisphaerales bacterium]